ncbi:hypothetical protein NDU88_003507 [Pleurodeles waltl]|uniref:Uncharacterized protein n=1 Tax=Pleurodeles waltl TaxID=8319 RepID=A0AAV7V2M8_PLEWA|nr:hypothetical protein NDU88_003507 [Pleurodeles waltl]
MWVIIAVAEIRSRSGVLAVFCMAFFKEQESEYSVPRLPDKRLPLPPLVNAIKANWYAHVNYSASTDQHYC